MVAASSMIEPRSWHSLSSFAIVITTNLASSCQVPPPESQLEMYVFGHFFLSCPENTVECGLVQVDRRVQSGTQAEETCLDTPPPGISPFFCRYIRMSSTNRCIFVPPTRKTRALGYRALKPRTMIRPPCNKTTSSPYKYLFSHTFLVPLTKSRRST